MAWYDEVERNLRKSREDSAEWEKKAVNWANETVDPWLLKTIPRGFWEWNRRNPEVSDKAGSGLRYVGRSLQQQRPRYEPWQNQMVDPNWGGGKFGAPSVTGFNPLIPLSGLLGTGYRLPGAALRRLSGRVPRQIRREPSMRFVRPNTSNVVRDYRRILRPQLGGRGTRFAGRRYGARTTLDDLKRDYTIR